MADPRDAQVQIDDGGVLRPIGKTASAALRTRKGAFRVVASPASVLLLRAAGEATPTLRLAGEIVAGGALVDILRLVADAGFRGELVVIGGGSRSIFLDGGHVVGAASDVPGEQLGEIMQQLGIITAAQIKAVTARMPFERKRFGETAIALGFVKREQLFSIAAQQTEEIVYAALRVADGSFYFVDGFDEERLSARLHVSAMALSAQGVARMTELKYFRERIPSPEYVPQRVDAREGPPAELIAAWPGMAEVHRAIDGRRTVNEIAQHAGRSELEVTQVLYQLVQSGLVVINPPLPTNAASVVAIFNDAIRTIFGVAARHGKDKALREHLSAYAAGVGVLGTLFAGAGPLADGTVDSARVAGNVATIAGADAVPALARWLHEYVAFALFDVGADIPKADHLALAQQVRTRLALLAPRASGSLPPPGFSLVPRSGTTNAPSAALSPSPIVPIAPIAPMAALAPPPSLEAEPIDLPATKQAQWPPPRPFGTAQGEPVGKLAPRLGGPPPPRTPSPLRETQRLHTSSPPPPAVEAAPSVVTSALGKTQMQMQVQASADAPLAAPLTPAPPPADTGPAPSDFSQSFDALALAESAVAANATPPPAPVDIPYTPHVSSPPAPIPTMDDLMDVDDVMATRQHLAQKPRRRTGLWIVLGCLFVASIVGGYVAYLMLQKQGDSSSKAEPETGEAEPTDEPPKKKKKAAKKDDDVTPSTSTMTSASSAMADASASASPSASVSTSATASAKPSTSASASPLPSTTASTVASTLATTTATATATATATTAKASTTATGDKTLGTLRTDKTGEGRRIFVDGKVVGEGPGPLTVPCGSHAIKVGSAGKTQQIDVPCGGEITLGM